MASKPLLLLALIFSLRFLFANSFDFEVGGDNGWIVPDSKNNDQIYNQWASKNRFVVNDTIYFKYKKDSVMEVSEKEYDKCGSSHPRFYSNNGDSVFTFEEARLYYFISGVAGHCERGLKMIIKVLEPATPPPQLPHSPPASHAATVGAMLLLLFMPIICFFFI